MSLLEEEVKVNWVRTTSDKDLEATLILIGVLEKKVQLLPYMRLQIVNDFSIELDKHEPPNPRDTP